MSLRLKLPMVPSPDITDNTNRARRLQLTPLHLSLPGVKDSSTELSLMETKNLTISARLLNPPSLKPLKLVS